jgi:hypothetical protein
MADNKSKANSIILGMNVQGDLGPMTMYTSKRKKLVAFLRAPPLNPPSPTQEIMRDLFRTYAANWRAAGQTTRDAWNSACKRCNLGLCGYTLWVWFSRTRDAGSLATIEQQSGLSLPRPPG